MVAQRVFLIRHGESEGNVASALAKQNDLSAYTPEFTQRPGREWSLTPLGIAQATATGEWLCEQFQNALPHQGANALHLVSPYRRTLETAHHLGLVKHDYTDHRSVQWEISRCLRERDWGDLDTLHTQQFEDTEFYKHSQQKRAIDPMYWRPPGGESMADMVDVRVPAIFDVINRHGGVTVAVSHGEMIRAVLVDVLGATDAEYVDWIKRKDMLIGNAEVIEFSSVVPEERFLGRFESPGDETRSWPRRNHYAYYRRVLPVQDPATGKFTMDVGEWREADNRRTYTNDELLNV